MSESITIFCFGDVVGRIGSAAFRRALKDIISNVENPFVVVNGENSAAGIGIDGESAHFLFSSGVNIITLGDHAFHHQKSNEVYKEFSDRVVRPANFPSGIPGNGYIRVKLENGLNVVIVNLLGRVFIDLPLDCPFRTIDLILKDFVQPNDLVIVDLHAEATSEKRAFGYYVDGRVSLVVGTHTHVQTNDVTILPNGTAYITDLGMSGVLESVIGMETQRAIGRFTTGMPLRYKTANGIPTLCGIKAVASILDKKINHIETFQIKVKV
jgi:2',3'-cyclic-nucleotide 2'-phosphodiesterase